MRRIDVEKSEPKPMGFGVGLERVGLSAGTTGQRNCGFDVMCWRVGR